MEATCCHLEPVASGQRIEHGDVDDDDVVGSGHNKYNMIVRESREKTVGQSGRRSNGRKERPRSGQPVSQAVSQSAIQ